MSPQGLPYGNELSGIRQGKPTTEPHHYATLISPLYRPVDTQFLNISTTDGGCLCETPAHLCRT